jgi:hypothetical protein
MKKFFILAMLISSTAFAGGFGGVEYGYRDGVNGGSDNQAVKVTVGTELNKTFKADISMRQKMDTAENLNDTRLEAGLTGTVPVGAGLSLYTRGAAGQKYKTNDNYAYYSVEPGIKYQVTDALGVKLGWRYRDAMDAAKTDQSRSWRVGAEYLLTKNYAVAVGYDQVRGDSAYNAVTTALNFKF